MSLRFVPPWALRSGSRLLDRLRLSVWSGQGLRVAVSIMVSMLRRNTLQPERSGAIIETIMDRLKAMQVFVEVADRGSLSAAAIHLDMSRAMVSRYLAEMEQWVGVRLLHRTTRRLSLTPAGAETLPRCRQMLDMVGDLRNAVSTPDDTPRGLLRITTSMSFGSRHLASAITDYVKLHPGTSVDLMLVDRAVNLVEERVDLAVRITNDLDPNLIARKLAVCRSVVCASPCSAKACRRASRTCPCATV
jgi:DNA-binding transcriptional LysR family regulator